MNSKSIFQMYREIAWAGPVLIFPVKKGGVLTGDWQGRWYRAVVDLEDVKNPAIIIEAPTIEVVVEKLHAAVMDAVMADGLKRSITEAEQAANGLRRMMKEDKLDL